jgi:hypothetical protein
MLNIIRSLSLETGALVIMAASAVMAIGVAFIPNTILRRGIASAIPFLLAYALYWSPVWLGADPLSIQAGHPFFIMPWFLAGLLASAIVIYLINRRHRIDAKLPKQ